MIRERHEIKSDNHHRYMKIDDLVWFMVFNATFNNISALLLEETGVHG
jgi:hypothetical protein